MSTDSPPQNASLNTTYTTVGVIGHIDHGKTSLVGKLTGIQTDTHPEEKRRGITIDLGFASMREGDHTFAFIDAPGHQKYIGNLLAGVSAVDVGLLVVACDQGIQEQTLEHVSILSTLNVPRMIVALSRVDLCEAERIEEIREELEVFLSDFGFVDFPIIGTSVVSGDGLEQLRKELCDASALRQKESTDAPQQLEELAFRMPIDRVLNVPGRGLVVAGTPWVGQVRIGDKLQLADRPLELRVREIEIHGEMTDRSRCGVRTAINLAGHDDSDISRGNELVAVEAYPLASSFLVSLQVYDEASEIKLPTTTQLHTATTSVEARLLGPKTLKPGERAVVLIETQAPILGVFGQAVLMRHPYPVGSFGGGRIVGVCNFDAKKLGKNKKEILQLGEQLKKATDALERALYWLELMGEFQPDQAWLQWQAGGVALSMNELNKAIAASEQFEQLGSNFVSASLLDRIVKFLHGTLKKHSEENEDQWVLQESIVKRASHMGAPATVKRAIAKLLELKDGDEAAVVGLNGMVAIASEKTRLSKKQRAKMEQMLKLYANTRTPPTVKEVCEKLSLTQDAVQSLARHATQQRVLHDLGQGFYIAGNVFREMCHQLAEMFESQPELTVPAVKDAWGVTRKHVIPLLEYCDREQITVRNQDGRVAGNRLAEYAGKEC
ncbi:MAG: selenocysteine-specific translation elongation factor [Planctomycetota bacterium]|nr:selenocysteine-specific translation elongation factor [Planctomycetota bacterium]